MIPIYQIIFHVFAAALVISSLMVVLTRKPVLSILFLILCFFSSAVLWVLIQAEFLGLVLIFVYVGAVMTLFLFLVMMLNIDTNHMKQRIGRYLPWGAAVLVLFVAIVIAVVKLHPSIAGWQGITHYPASYNNTVEMGQLLFTKYLYAFEIAAAILLVAMISAIALAFRGPQHDRRSQSMHQQHQATKANRLRIVKNMKGDGL
jgi:NADH-quinone oxidoreductase subunit J